MATNNSTKQITLELSIQVSLDGLSFCTLNSTENKVVQYKKIRFSQQIDPLKLLEEIQKIYAEEKSIAEATQVKLIFDNALYSLVPEPLFKEENASDYLKFNTKILKTDFIAHEEIGITGIINVYIPYTNIINFFFEKFGEFEYQHLSTVLVENLLKLPKAERPQMFAHIKNKQFELVVIENCELLLCNSFSFTEKEDFLYYILFTAEQLNLDPEKFRLILLGAISKASPLFKIAFDYIKHVELLETSFSLNLEEELTGLNQLEEYVLLKSFK
ncbi:hypothetical protein APR41_18260 [Salegentibacter salinarum]|uniref:DUF3822 domain-containing protein n=1 Tax=Salegentibacter salinarum TaxID=447422 RepID=A0A2N0TTA9_9FLAO|nr:DUF3822 family protein [Salegentibacter salinarum]PKD17973.1 hypothetical protein APR41_18260 [Salegentibacter salinarum]SKB99876.1 Protein of unknown function [Salegentibacter salinarum]